MIYELDRRDDRDCVVPNAGHLLLFFSFIAEGREGPYGAQNKSK